MTSPEFQRLPLPVGSPHPVRRPGRPPRRRPPLVALAGLVAAGAGAALGAASPTVEAGLDGRDYRIGGVSLPALGDGVYAGPQGAVIVVDEPSGIRAAASTRLHGTPTRGVCTLPRGGSRERCTFEIAGRTVGCTDELRAGGWDRTCADGSRARIALAGGRPLPVPIAVGR